MGDFYEAATVSIIVSSLILAGLMVYVWIKGDDFDDFAN